MGKPKILPLTKSESAEERLEEIIRSKSVQVYKLLLEKDDAYSIYVRNGECRSYPDGFEALNGEGSSGVLYIERRNTVVFYDFKKDSEAREKK